MNRKFIISSLFVLTLAAFSGHAYAQAFTGPGVVTVTAAVAFSTTSVVITHSPISRVSNDMRLLVAVGAVTVSGASASLAADNGVVLKYYTDDNASVRTASATITNASGGAFSFYTDKVFVPASSSKVFYQIVATAADNTAGYFPQDASYREATLDQTSQTDISAASGGTLTLQSGNQLRGDTTLTFAARSLPADTHYAITEMYVGESGIPPSSPDSPIIVYNFTPDIAISNRSLYPVITLYYGDMPADANKIEVRWWNPLESKWQKVSSTNDTNLCIETVSLALTGTKLGYYAVFPLSNLTDNSYRPKNKAFMYPNGMQFNNLNAGDSVAIYNLNGKMVRKLTAPPFIWDGRYDNGTIAESGTYIYQISVNGKIINGQIAYVR